MILRQMLDWPLGGSFLGFFSLSGQSDREINQGSAVLWNHLNEGEIKVLRSQFWIL